MMRDQVVLFQATSEKCHTSKLILRISWINYVFDKCYRGLTKREEVAYFLATSEKCRTSKLILRISWIKCEGSASGLWVLLGCSARGLWALCECSVNALRRATLQAVWWNQSNLCDVSNLEGYTTVLILETPFWVDGAAEWMKIRKMAVGSSNRSGRVWVLSESRLMKSV